MRSMRRSRRRDNLRVTAEINMTNLIDVAFVLLIIFMITAPIFQGGIELELPQADAAPVTSAETVVVSIAQDGRIYIGETEVNEGEFRNIFPVHLPSKEDPVFIKSDANALVKHQTRVLGMLMDMGYRKTSLVVEPQPGG
jgi:biopolymer transport protein TolR